MNNQKNMYSVKEEGFVTASYWQKSIHLMTVDEDGNQVDCYDKVVEDMKDRESNVVNHFKKEERKNKLINHLYNMQLKVLIASVIVSILIGIMYVVFVVMGRTDLFAAVNTFLADKLSKSMYANISRVLEPVNTSIIAYISANGLENILMDALKIMLIISLGALLIFMLGRDYLPVRWVNKLTRIKPLCKTKADSDNRVARLKSDLYNLQLRQHNVKYATHDK